MNCKKSILLFSVSLGIAFYANSSLAEDEQTHDNDVFLIDNVATYQDGKQISENAKDECELDRNIPNAIVKFSRKFKIDAALHEAEKTEAATSKIVSLEIGNLIGGRGGNGFGGRWVVSEIGVMVTLKRGDKTEVAHKYFACSAGLGANPFGNFRACDRLGRCTEQIAKRVAKWLSSAADASD